MNFFANDFRKLLKFLPSRKQSVIFWYLLFIMLPVAKHSLASAAKLSGKSKSAFSKMLANSKKTAGQILMVLLKELAKQLTFRRPIVSGSPWTIAVIIDSTIHKRSSKKAKNAQKFNHGKGYEFGHQFTNIVILINGIILPLEPIPFYTKRHCKKHGLIYQTEHQRIINYLQNLDLNTIIGIHCTSEVVVLMDSGYDDRAIYNTVIEKSWDFIGSLKCDSHFRLESSSKSKSRRADDMFKLAGTSLWETVYVWINGLKKKRKDFRACAIKGYLNRLKSLVTLVCSEPRRDSQKKRKYIVCSNTLVSTGIIVRTYRVRWMIEIFHKDVKSLLGVQDVAAHEFESVASHVNLVYASYTLLNLLGSKGSIHERQMEITEAQSNAKLGTILRMSYRFGGHKKIQEYCRAVIQGKRRA